MFYLTLQCTEMKLCLYVALSIVEQLAVSVTGRGTAVQKCSMLQN